MKNEWKMIDFFSTLWYFLSVKLALLAMVYCVLNNFY